MNSINGTGTRLLGELPTRDGIVVTQWACLLYLPLFPVRSYLLLEEGERVSTVFGFERSDRVARLPGRRLDWESVAGTATWAILAWVGVGLAALVVAVAWPILIPPPRRV